jgi:CO/xanthine dehydrogenase FAD-binding subunit
VAVWLVPEGGKVREIAISCGGVSPTPVRARQAETAFRGQPLDAERVRSLAEEIQSDIRPISDVRGSAEYRRRVTAALLARAVRHAASLEEGEKT